MISVLEHRIIATSAWTFTGEADDSSNVYCDDLIALNTLIRHVMLRRPAVARHEAGS